MIKIVSIVLFFQFYSFAKYEQTKIDDLSAAKLSLNKVEAEILEIENSIDELEKREKKFYDMRLRFSDLMTNFAASEVYNPDIQDNKEILEDLEEELLSWIDHSNSKIEKINGLIAALREARNSYIEASKANKNELGRKYARLSFKANSYLKRLRILKKKINKHLELIDKYKTEADKWKQFLITKIRKGLDRNLFNWQLNKVFSGPKVLLEKSKHNIKVIVDRYQDFNGALFLDGNIKSFIPRLIILFIILGLIYKLSSRLILFTDQKSNLALDPNLVRAVELIISHRNLLYIAPLMIIIVEKLGPFSYTGYPSHLGVILLVTLISIFWVKLGNPVVGHFVNEINKSKKKKKKIHFGLIPVLVFILTKTIQHYYEIEDDILSLFNSVLLLYISYKFLILCLRFKFYIKRFKMENLAIFLKSTKLFISIFTCALLLSAFLEIIGFLKLGKSIQGVVISNMLSLGFAWLAYQMISYYLISLRKKIQKNENFDKNIEFVDFFRNTLNITFVSGVIVAVLYAWYSTVFIFSDFWNISIFKLGEFDLTIDKPVKLIFCYFSIRFLYLCINYYLDSFILEKFNISRRYSSNISSMLRYVFILVFLSIGAATLGMTYKNLIIFASALGVGIGFGLQNIVNNFLSGIILLFEQPIRIGDIIEVNDFLSRVKHIGIRSTIVESFDNSSIIIPNSDIISNKLTNWTLNGNIVAIRCYVGVSYGTDTEFVTEILNEVAKENENILFHPPHQIWFSEFADSSLNFTLRGFINRPSDKFTIKSEILHAINKKFKENGITIPFPQRDVHLYEESDSKII